MSVNQCILCATPGVQVKGGCQKCAGCGTVCLQDLALYQRRAHTRIDFYRATLKFEQKRPFKFCESFGQFLIDSNFELIGKP